MSTCLKVQFDFFFRELLLPEDAGFRQDVYMWYSRLYAIVSWVVGTKRRILEHIEHRNFLFCLLVYSCHATALVKSPTANVSTNGGLLTRSFYKRFLAVTSLFFARAFRRSPMMNKPAPSCDDCDTCSCLLLYRRSTLACSFLFEWAFIVFVWATFHFWCHFFFSKSVCEKVIRWTQTSHQVQT